MSYVSVEEWLATGGHLGPDEDDSSRILDRLEAASRYLDRLLGRAWPLDIHEQARMIDLADDRKVRLGSDRPTADHHRWHVQVTADVTILDPDGSTVATVVAAQVVTMFAGSHGWLILPDSAPTGQGRMARVTYKAGFSSNGPPTWTPWVPDVLREATIEIARGITFRDLDQRDPLDVSLAGAWKARAVEHAGAHAWHAVA